MELILLKVKNCIDETEIIPMRRFTAVCSRKEIFTGLIDALSNSSKNINQIKIRGVKANKMFFISLIDEKFFPFIVFFLLLFFFSIHRI